MKYIIIINTCANQNLAETKDTAAHRIMQSIYEQGLARSDPRYDARIRPRRRPVSSAGVEVARSADLFS